MKVFTKLTAMLMVVVMFTVALASCGNFGKRADKYVATVQIKYATNDEKMKDVVYAMNSSSTLSVNKDEIKLENLTVLDDISMNDGYVFVDDTLYHYTKVTAGGKTVTSLEKAEMNQTSIDVLLNNFLTGANIGTEDFDTCTSSGSGKNLTYNCTDIKADSKEGLCRVFASKFEGSGATVVLEGADFILETEGDFKTSSTLSCHFAITMNGEEYKVTMHVVYSYDYEAKVDISAPQDADQYKTVSYDEIMK